MTNYSIGFILYLLLLPLIKCEYISNHSISPIYFHINHYELSNHTQWTSNYNKNELISCTINQPLLCIYKNTDSKPLLMLFYNDQLFDFFNNNEWHNINTISLISQSQYKNSNERRRNLLLRRRKSSFSKILRRSKKKKRSTKRSRRGRKRRSKKRRRKKRRTPRKSRRKRRRKSGRRTRRSGRSMRGGRRRSRRGRRGRIPRRRGRRGPRGPRGPRGRSGVPAIGHFLRGIRHSLKHKRRRKKCCNSGGCNDCPCMNTMCGSMGMGGMGGMGGMSGMGGMGMGGLGMAPGMGMGGMGGMGGMSMGGMGMGGLGMAPGMGMGGMGAMRAMRMGMGGMGYGNPMHTMGGMEHMGYGQTQNQYSQTQNRAHQAQGNFVEPTIKVKYTDVHKKKKVKHGRRLIEGEIMRGEYEYDYKDMMEKCIQNGNILVCMVYNYGYDNVFIDYYKDYNDRFEIGDNEKTNIWIMSDMNINGKQIYECNNKLLLLGNMNYNKICIVKKEINNNDIDLLIKSDKKGINNIILSLMNHKYWNEIYDINNCGYNKMLCKYILGYKMCIKVVYDYKMNDIKQINQVLVTQNSAI